MSKSIGIQLYTVREAVEQDYDATIRRIAEIGYTGVETAGFPGTTPQHAAQLFSELGLSVIAAHSAMPVGEHQNQVLDTMAAIGCKILVCPYIPSERFVTADDIRVICGELDEAYQVAQANGLTLLYHNHDWEYRPLPDGRYPYRLMAEWLNPAIGFELDAYWAQTAGMDPVAVLAELGSRVQLLHVKDGPAVKTASMQAVGDGVVDYTKIIPAASGSDWAIVELDRCDTDMMEAVTKSYSYLTQKGLAHGKHA